MADEKLPEEVTKHSFRWKMWDYMTKNDLVNSPWSIHNRIPSFKGAAEAALHLAELEEFKKAKTIKINPDRPQKSVRFLALEANKEILVPIPRLRSGLFLHITPVAGATKEMLEMLSTMHGMEQTGKPLGIDSNIKVDLVVLGSVCVSHKGYRLGKGEGFADLEFAMMMRMGAVNENTTIVTTVHDCQIVDNLPPQMFKDYDVPVDIIVTPTQTIFVQQRLKRPVGIIWEMLSQRRLKTMQVLRQLKQMDEKDGKEIVLKEIDSDTETRQYYKSRPKQKKRNKKQFNIQEATNANDSVLEDKNVHIKKDFVRKGNSKKSVETDDTSSSKEKQGKAKRSDKNRKYYKTRLKSNIEFSLKLSNISYGARIRDLKSALLQRGVKPSEITWQGSHGICYLHFSKLKNGNTLPDQPVLIDSIIANLQKLHIGESTDKENDFIIVEPAKPISRIEVTDISAV